MWRKFDNVWKGNISTTRVKYGVVGLIFMRSAYIPYRDLDLCFGKLLETIIIPIVSIKLTLEVE